VRICLQLLFGLAALCLSACHIRGGEPDEGEIFSALQDNIEHSNDRGGMKINLGSMGGFQTIQFNTHLLRLEKHQCSGGEHTYTCKVTAEVNFPPVKEESEWLDLEIILFDGPGGWRVIESKTVDRRLTK
jgi:hypothetical protein